MSIRSIQDADDAIRIELNRVWRTGGMDAIESLAYCGKCGTLKGIPLTGCKCCGESSLDLLEQAVERLAAQTGEEK